MISTPEERVLIHRNQGAGTCQDSVGTLPFSQTSTQEIAISYRNITYEHIGPTTFLTLNRAEHDNRIGQDLAEELRDACRAIRENEAVGVVVVTGEGGAFSVGREPWPQDLDLGSAEAQKGWIQQLQVASAVAALPVPVIMSINGDALGHGLELALAGDIRICSDNANLGLDDLSQEGRFPWDGGTQRLPRLVGPAWAADLLLTSRIISATEALKIGLANRVVPAQDLAAETRRLADDIAAGGPIAARYAKEAITQGMDLSLDDGLRLEADLNVILQNTQDRAEGLRSFTEKHSPRYTGR